jgi:hypothetical protein
MSPNHFAPKLAVESRFSNCVYENDGLGLCYGSLRPSAPFYETSIGLLTLAVFLFIIAVIIIVVIRRRRK